MIKNTENKDINFKDEFKESYSKDFKSKNFKSKESNLDLLRDTFENGEELYTENFLKECSCNCSKKGIIFLKERS